MLVVRWIVRRGGEAAQLGLFKREMDRGSEQGTNIPLQRAHDSASICTPLSLPPIHHSHTASTSCFHPTPVPFSLTCLIPECEGDSAVSYLSWQSISCCICREHTGRGAHAETRAGSGWLCGWMAVSDTLRTTVPVCLLRAWQALW